MPEVIEKTITVGESVPVYLVPTDQNDNPMPLPNQVNWDTPDDPSQTFISYNPGPIDPTMVTGVNLGIVELRGSDGVIQRRERFTVIAAPQVESGGYITNDPPA